MFLGFRFLGFRVILVGELKSKLWQWSGYYMQNQTGANCMQKKAPYFLFSLSAGNVFKDVKLEKQHGQTLAILSRTTESYKPV